MDSSPYFINAYIDIALSRWDIAAEVNELFSVKKKKSLPIDGTFVGWNIRIHLKHYATGSGVRNDQFFSNSVKLVLNWKCSCIWVTSDVINTYFCVPLFHFISLSYSSTFHFVSYIFIWCNILFHFTYFNIIQYFVPFFIFLHDSIFCSVFHSFISFDISFGFSYFYKIQYFVPFLISSYHSTLRFVCHIFIWFMFSFHWSYFYIVRHFVPFIISYMIQYLIPYLIFS